VDLQVLCQSDCALKLSVSHVFCGFWRVGLVLRGRLCAFLVREVVCFGAQGSCLGDLFDL